MFTFNFYIFEINWLIHGKLLLVLRLKKSIRFLVSLNRIFIFVANQWFMYMYICGYWNQTKFPIHNIWWLREASQIGQTFTPHTPCETVIQNNSMTEFQSIQQFWLQMDIIFTANKKTKKANVRVWGAARGDRNRILFFGCLKHMWPRFLG